MKSHYENLFNYNHWANDLCLQGLENAVNPPPKTLSLFSHILSAQFIWLHRILDLPTTPFPLWEEYNLRELRSMIEEGTERWLKFIDNYPNDNFGEVINYTNTKGNKYNSSVLEIITHVINHGTYHRGQIALLMRKSELNPAVTDYIVHQRNV